MPDAATAGAVLVGVEEEFLLIDTQTQEPAPRIGGVIRNAKRLAGDQAQEELHQAQIEHATAPCDSLADLRAEIVEMRTSVVKAAGEHGTSVAASGTYQGAMGAEGQRITVGDRYEEMARINGLPAREQLICGCHIHVSVPDYERAIRVANQVRAWLPWLLALSANSPFWEGEDTGFASYRSEVWTRWPTSGPPGFFESGAAYQSLLNNLVEADIIIDQKMAYWDVRPSERFPTIEIRVNDVMTSVDDVVALAGLARGLVLSCGDEPDGGRALRSELLRAATWRAALSGLSGQLLNPADGVSQPAAAAIDALLEHVRPALESRGEFETIEGLTHAIVQKGNGAAHQRRAWQRQHDLADVIGSVTLGVDGQPPAEV